MSPARPTSKRVPRRATAPELRARIAASRAALGRRGAKGGGERRRRWGALALLIALLLVLWALLGDCSREEAPAPEAAPGVAVERALPPRPPPPEPEPPEPPAADLARRERPAYESAQPEPLSWIASFRMQVSARSPRLAECFVGAPGPGRFKWTVSVEPGLGHVSEHTFEPMLQGGELTQEQRECVVGVLSDPPYRLQSNGERSTPSRVALVIEF